MKSIIAKRLVCYLSIACLCLSCNKAEDLQKPGISIYKTKGDYFNLVDIGMKDGLIFRRSSYSNVKSGLIIMETDTLYKGRERLINGYILDSEADYNYDVYLSLTFKNHMKMELEYGFPTLPNDTLIKYILDETPYIEYYRDKGTLKKFDISDTAEINEIIRKGELEHFFQRYK